MRKTMCAATMLILSASVADAAKWRIDEANSSLGFEATQGSASFQGDFPSFDGEIVFDANDPASGRLDIEVTIAGVTTHSAERDAQILSSTWFAESQFPKAVYSAEGFTATDDGYRAEGVLELKGIRQELPLVFDVTIDGDRAVADGEAVMVRTDYQIGTGQFAAGTTVGLEVKVVFHIEADRVDPASPAGR